MGGHRDFGKLEWDSVSGKNQTKLKIETKHTENEQLTFRPKNMSMVQWYVIFKARFMISYCLETI